MLESMLKKAQSWSKDGGEKKVPSEPTLLKAL
jgi:hypothetical protein